MKMLIHVSLALFVATLFARAEQARAPVHFAVFGLAHEHAGGFIPRAKDGKDVQLVGIIEPRTELVSRYAKRFQLDRGLFYSSLDELLAKTKAQGIIQASWNWPFDRKDMEIYGQSGYVLVPRPDALRVREAKSAETEKTVPALTGAQADPLSCLAAVVRGDLKPGGLSSLSVNLIVTEILDAARESARTGKRIELR